MCVCVGGGGQRRQRQQREQLASSENAHVWKRTHSEVGGAERITGCVQERPRAGWLADWVVLVLRYKCTYWGVACRALGLANTVEQRGSRALKQDAERNEAHAYGCGLGLRGLALLGLPIGSGSTLDQSSQARSLAAGQGARRGR